MAKRSAPKARSKNKTAVKLASKARGLVKAALAKAKAKKQTKPKSSGRSAARATTKKLVAKSKTRAAEAPRASAPRTASKSRAVAPRPVKSPPRPSAARVKGKPAKAAKPVALSEIKSTPAAPKRTARKPAPRQAAPAPLPVTPAATSNGAELAAGAAAPSFELTDEDGSPVNAQTLAGKPYVLYFYPKDDTPGCTAQACGFRDSLNRFAQRGVRVIGVSPDSPQSHTKFKQKYGLNFTLLSDKDKELAQAYGVWAKKTNYGREYMGIERSTFLVDESGTIKKAWRKVRVPGHVDAVLAELGT